MPGEHSQGNNSNPGEGGGTGNGDGNGGGQQQQTSQTTTTPPANSNDGGAQFDPAALTPEQLNQVLEKNPNIWKTDRLAELREKGSKFDKLAKEKEEADKKALEEQGKFKELSESQKTELENLRQKLQDRDISTALITKLSPLGVVDLEGALKLVDRSKIEVSDDGTVTGVDEAVEALKTDKAYLFNGSQSGKPQVGSPTNPGNGSGTGEPPKFKASQFRGPEGAKFYQENREEILKAQAEGRIEQD